MARPAKANASGGREQQAVELLCGFVRASQLVKQVVGALRTSGFNVNGQQNKPAADDDRQCERRRGVVIRQPEPQQFPGIPSVRA